MKSNCIKFDLSRMPFSTCGSYLAVSEIQEDFRGFKNKAGLHLRTVHGSARTPLVARIAVLYKGGESGFESVLEKGSLVLSLPAGKLELCFQDSMTMLIRGCGEDIGLLLDFLTETGPYDYIYEVPGNGISCYMANCFKNNCRYLVIPRKGETVLEQKWEESSALYSRLRFSGENGFEFVLKEIETEWDKIVPDTSFDECRETTWKEFESFYKMMPEVAQRYQDTAYQAAFLNWSSIVRKDGFLTRDGMLMSKNWMCNVWSWDHCFNAIALSYGNPEMAWEQFMIMFDHQDATGLLPDSINDVHVVWNYCKPPVHGWALRLMMHNMELNENQKKEAYCVLKKWTNWWLNYRDYDQDGLCEYNHGNDSGWDNSTAFSELPPVATAELQAFLVVQMEVLAELCRDLGNTEEQQVWEKQADTYLKRMLEKCFRDDLPVSIKSGSHKVIENDSLLPYVSIVLGERLPEEKRKKMIEVLESGRFFTEYGFATESPASGFYRPDGYWRGPIWAPSTMLILDGLARCGELEFVRKASEKFADMTAKSGFAENFNALTGEGLRDRAYTWTSSVFLILAHEYLR